MWRVVFVSVVLACQVSTLFAAPHASVRGRVIHRAARPVTSETTVEERLNDVRAVLLELETEVAPEAKGDAKGTGGEPLSKKETQMVQAKQKEAELAAARAGKKAVAPGIPETVKDAAAQRPAPKAVGVNGTDAAPVFSMDVNAMTIAPPDNEPASLVLDGAKQVSITNNGDGTLTFLQDKSTIFTLYANGSAVIGAGDGPRKLMLRALETWMFETIGHNFRIQKSSGANWERVLLIRSDGSIDILNDIKAHGVLADSVDIAGDLRGDKAMYLHGVKQWTLIAHHSFDQGSQGWIDVDTSEAVETTVCGGMHLLGGFCKLSKHTVSMTFAGLPPHSHIRVQANFHYIDQWQGNTAFAKLDDKQMWQQSYRAPAEMDGVNICGTETPEAQFTVPIDASIDHTGDQFVISFGSTLEGDPCVASWGISSVLLYWM
eukprot:GFYU01005197.1.p1 GENE.GFYU01005197.1~~GFYU01005197.1.p1  ORF type:complete len:461 (-),score=95.69 GFYU01005197.1:324-1619(-)